MDELFHTLNLLYYKRFTDRVIYKLSVFDNNNKRNIFHQK